jgi:hypothetical protein
LGSAQWQVGLPQREWVWVSVPGKKVVRDGNAAQEVELALAKACGLRAFRIAVHIVAMMLQTKRKSKPLF